MTKYQFCDTIVLNIKPKWLQKIKMVAKITIFDIILFEKRLCVCEYFISRRLHDGDDRRHKQKSSFLQQGIKLCDYSYLKICSIYVKVFVHYNLCIFIILIYSRCDAHAFVFHSYIHADIHSIMHTCMRIPITVV